MLFSLPSFLALVLNRLKCVMRAETVIVFAVGSTYTQEEAGGHLLRITSQQSLEKSE